MQSYWRWILASKDRQPNIAPPLGTAIGWVWPRIRRQALPNGLGVWSINTPWARTATAVLVVEAGAVHEPTARAGLAEVVADLRVSAFTPSALGDRLCDIGGSVTGSVNQLVASFSITGSLDAASDLIESLGLLSRQRNFTVSECLRARDRQLARTNEIARDDRQLATVTCERALDGEDYSPATAEAYAAAISSGDVRTFVSRRYRPDHSTLIVVGFLHPRQVIDLARKSFGRWRSQPISFKPTLSGRRRRAKSGRLTFSANDAHSSEVRIGHAWPSPRSPHYPALAALHAVLGSGMRGRLNQAIRERRGLTYGVELLLSRRASGSSVVSALAVERGQTAEAVRLVLGEYERLISQGVRGDELRLAALGVKRAQVTECEDTESLASVAATLVGLSGSRGLKAVAPMVGDVTPAMVQAAARRYLLPTDATIVLAG